MIKRPHFFSLLTVLFSLLLVLSATAEVDKSYIDQYIKNLQKAQDNKFISCKNDHESTLQLLKLIKNQSQNIKESNRPNKCNLIAIDAMVLNFEKHLQEFVSFGGSKTEYEQKAQLKECQYAKQTLISILNTVNDENFKKCLYSLLLETSGPKSVKNNTDKNQNQINVNLLKDAMNSLVNIDLKNFENKIGFIKENVEIIEKQLIELIVIQIKNPEKFNPEKKDWCVQNLSIEVTSLLDDIKFIEQCKVEKNCNGSELARFKSSLMDVQKSISTNSYDKCFSQFE